MKKKFGNQFVYETTWKNEKLHCWMSLFEILKNSIVSQTDPVYEMNWITSKFHISNGLIKKIQTAQDLIQSNNKLELFHYLWNSHSFFIVLKFFRNWFRLWNHLECFLNWIACRKKLLANRYNIWNELNYFNFPKLKCFLKKRKVFSNKFSLEMKWNT